MASATASQDKVIITWQRESNQTINEFVAIIRTDNGATFEPLLKLSANVISQWKGSD